MPAAVTRGWSLTEVPSSLSLTAELELVKLWSQQDARFVVDEDDVCMLQLSFILCPSAFFFFFFNASSSPQHSTHSCHAPRTPLVFPNDLLFWGPRILVDKISCFKPLFFWSIQKVCALTHSGIGFPPLCSVPHQRWLLLTHWEMSCEAWRRHVSFIASSTDLEAPSLVNVWHEGWTICSVFPGKLAIWVNDKTERYSEREKSLHASR